MILHHKTDVMKAGEDIVYIVITSGHRKELFPALNEVIRAYKSRSSNLEKGIHGKRRILGS
ncbi:molybdenum cofactor biosynthesis protein MoaE [Methanosarcina barkeri]|uniref:Uncharacterized protein n=1 Tax=Methanosarcina barkeri (strain Fusaro / DSM 804) TaxID=269797 RepID=Q468W1_METBF|nr:molybdenum cofactor biosynthesis protein MoaE [Methanosarcina barkeri]